MSKKAKVLNSGGSMQHPLKPGQKIEIFGDANIQLESAEQIIEFPGGSISIARCNDGSYWAHIAVNHENNPNYFTLKGMKGRIGGSGKIERIRFDSNRPCDTDMDKTIIENLENQYHFAVLISTKQV